jgi:hypothetical protein
MSIYYTIKRIERLMQAETDPHKRQQYRTIIKQTIDKLEG